MLSRQEILDNTFFWISKPYEDNKCILMKNYIKTHDFKSNIFRLQIQFIWLRSYSSAFHFHGSLCNGIRQYLCGQASPLQHAAKDLSFSYEFFWHNTNRPNNQSVRKGLFLFDSLFSSASFAFYVDCGILTLSCLFSFSHCMERAQIICTVATYWSNPHKILHRLK